MFVVENFQLLSPYEAIRISDVAQTDITQNQILNYFAYAKQNQLTVDNIIEISEAIFNENSRDKLLSDFVTAQRSRLDDEEINSIKELISSWWTRRKI